ncbi:hypothetical protein [Streptomyces sp. NPDC058434]|uniref:hypothetical protein n=1 Tax=Streptomyces sp. NPDC058434 TaxID=3346498 RepID=UPI00365CDA63
MNSDRMLFPPGRLGEPRRYSDPRREVEQPGSDVKFPPVENGIDYLLSVIDLLAKEDDTKISARELKYSVLHLQAAAEVLLKARLLQVDWKLVPSRLNRQVTREQLDAGTVPTCGAVEAADRLGSPHIGIDIGQEAKDALTDLKDVRNRLQHYGLTDTAPAIEAKAARVLHFLIRFLHEQLLPAVTTDERERIHDDMERIRAGLTHIQALVMKRMEWVRKELADRRDRTLNCPHCRQLALLVEGGWTTCYFCSLKSQSGQAAHDYVFYVLGRWWGMDEEDPVKRCPECGFEDLVSNVTTAAAPETPIPFCFHCG